uniref:Polymerase nucleotidyl transferase domain-containing protein n=1 Tax=Thermofilum pendens TaxID=2269 RepID=A0A7J3X5Z7_THEPE
MFWVRYHLNHLRAWREAAKAVARAAKDLDPSAEVYVVGGAAEGRLTVLSDVDVVVVLGKASGGEEVNRLRRALYTRAVDLYGLPWDYPVEIHVMTREEFNEAFPKKNKKVVKLE